MMQSEEEQASKHMYITKNHKLYAQYSDGPLILLPPYPGLRLTIMRGHIAFSYPTAFRGAALDRFRESYLSVPKVCAYSTKIVHSDPKLSPI